MRWHLLFHHQRIKEWRIRNRQQIIKKFPYHIRSDFFGTWIIFYDNIIDFVRKEKQTFFIQQDVRVDTECVNDWCDVESDKFLFLIINHNKVIICYYLLCVSNLRMIVSMIVVFGATWPRLTGIFMVKWKLLFFYS